MNFFTLMMADNFVKFPFGVKPARAVKSFPRLKVHLVDEQDSDSMKFGTFDANWWIIQLL